MPRAAKARTSLPSHSRAPKAAPAPSQAITTADGLEDQFEMDMADVEPLPAPEPVVQQQAVEQQEEKQPRLPKEKQTKAEKAYNKRKALLDKLSASASPYSKSHARRIRRAAKPENNLVASLNEFKAMLPEVEPLRPAEPESGDAGMDDEEEELEEKQEKRKDGKGVEKLTAKKRQRVLTAESARLPAIIKNASFSALPFATIRQHTLNTLVTKVNPPPTVAKGKKGKK
ncbi:hypothetical protein JCM8547_001458 [Rhodosporidiobolus lusitaniae]